MPAPGQLTYTMETLQVLGLFRSGQRLHGYAVCGETGLSVRTGYRVLDRLTDHGLLSRETERVDPGLSSRVPRIVYRMTTCGMDRMREIRALVST